MTSRLSARHQVQPRSLLLLGLMLACFSWFLGGSAWTLAEGKWISRGPVDYYHFATEAALNGRLHLSITPRQELAQLSNPYDSGLNIPYRVLDLSYYRGKYYFYWGLAPVVLFFAPCYLLFGVYPTEALASAVFGLAALGVWADLLLRIRREHFSNVTWPATTLLLGCLGVCSLLPSIVGNVYNVPIAAAAFGQALALWTIHRLLQRPRAELRWLLLLGFAASCAIASRPNYVLWLWVIAAAPLLLAWRERKRALAILAAAAGLPALTGGLMLALNYARFGKVAEFGMHYQLTGPHQPEVLLSPAHIPANLGVYGWNLPEATSLYPFVYEPAGGPFGIATFPVVLAMVGLCWLPAKAATRLTAWTAAACGVGGLLATCAFFGCGRRYMLDFAPATIFAGCVGALCMLGRTQGYTRLLRGAVGALLVASVLLGVLLQPRAWTRGEEVSRSAAQFLNRFTFWCEDLAGRAYGPLVVKFQLPVGRTGSFEPLISTGSASLGGEAVFLHYVDERHVQVGFFQTGTTHWLSKPLEVDYSAEQTLLVALGSLLPHESHPSFDSWRESARKTAAREAVLILNGQLVYKSALFYSDAARARWSLGENQIAAGVSAARFTGSVRAERIDFRQLLPEQYAALISPVQAEVSHGAWRLRLRLPENPPPGRYDPLLVSGVTGAGDFVYLFYPERNKIAFGHDCWGYGGSASESVVAEWGGEHTIEVDHSGLRGRADFTPGRASTGRPYLRVILNGQVVMETEDKTYDAAPDTVVIGENRLGGSTTAPVFSGEIKSAERLSK